MPHVCIFANLIILVIVWNIYFGSVSTKPKQLFSFNADMLAKEKDNFLHCCITFLEFSHLCDDACVFLMAKGILQKLEFYLFRSSFLKIFEFEFPVSFAF